ncbi:MAG: hypothetical protein JRI85_03925 [Deltaproteobacteria bacterium]|nr:hypothetical protein [Deltaproteobacteria bacterium]
MTSFTQFKNQFIARLSTRFPVLGKRFTNAFVPWETEGVPWAPASKPLSKCKVALVTTAGVHHRSQQPFDMRDPQGDPTFREIEASRPITNLMITHDYYNHADADKDINVVFPIERLWDFEDEGLLGKAAETHYSFMGHIQGPHIQTLIYQNAPEVARRLKNSAVDLIILTPG